MVAEGKKPTTLSSTSGHMIYWRADRRILEDAFSLLAGSPEEMKNHTVLKDGMKMAAFVLRLDYEHLRFGRLPVTIHAWETRTAQWWCVIIISRPGDKKAEVAWVSRPYTRWKYADSLFSPTKGGGYVFSLKGVPESLSRRHKRTPVGEKRDKLYDEMMSRRKTLETVRCDARGRVLP